MHIFIDEAGSFSASGGNASISAVGALVVPESKWAKLRHAYGGLRGRLPQENGEVKGRRLSEEQAAAVIQLLRRHEALFEATVIDLGMHTPEIISYHQANQAEGVTSTLTDEHHPSVVEALWTARRQLEAFSQPLYVQTMLIFSLVRAVLELAPNYYAQRRPRELAAFHWVVDAKDRQLTPTRWEQWWSTFIMPWMQTAALRSPIAWYRGEGFNFRFARRFETEASEFYRSLVSQETGQQSVGWPLDLKLMLSESIRFSSAPEPGLELVDIVTTTLRRAIVGNIGREGWQDLPSLIVNRTGENLHILALTGADKPAWRLDYTDVIKAFRHSPRSMFP
ncbi:hypothetical protein ACWIGM_05045 [Bosea sp. NPDC055332]